VGHSNRGTIPILKILDTTLSLLAIGIGILHSFIVAPQIYNALTPNAFWFFAAGLAIIFTGLLNMLRVVYGTQTRGVHWVALLASLVMLALILTFAWSQKEMTNPVVALQIIAYAGLVAMAVIRRP